MQEDTETPLASPPSPSSQVSSADTLQTVQKEDTETPLASPPPPSSQVSSADTLQTVQKDVHDIVATGEDLSHGLASAAEDSTGSTGEESGEAGTAHARCAPVDGDRADTVAGIHRTGSVEVDDTPMTQHDMGVRHVAPVAAGWFLHGPFQHLLVLT